MGGTVPLGYDVVERQLVISPPEAETVRAIYKRYLELGSIRLLKQDFRRDTAKPQKTLFYSEKNMASARLGDREPSPASARRSP